MATKVAITLDDLRAGPPTIDVATAARALGISRSYGFELVRRGAFPCQVIPVGNVSRVLTASLVRLLEGGDGGDESAAGRAAALLAASA